MHSDNKLKETVLPADVKPRQNFIVKRTHGRIANVNTPDKNGPITLVLTNMSCDLVHNMCGWFLQFNDGGRCHRSELKAANEDQAVFAAFDLGFEEMEIWDFEQHIKCVRIPKGKHDFNNGYNRPV